MTHELRGGALDQRVEPSGPPEVREVGLAVNLLADRIGDLLRAEREAAADVSHRLRTPLTALRLSVEHLQDGGDAARVAHDLDALEHSVDDVIRETRRPVAAVDPRCDLVAAVEARSAFWSVLAEEQHRRLDVTLPAGPAWVGIAAHEVDATLDGLLNNVFAHTVAGSPLAVSVVADPAGGWLLSVADGGAGFGTSPPDAPGEGRRRGSTGLGLDIARRSAERSGGSLRTSRSALGGALVELRFGPPDPG